LIEICGGETDDEEMNIIEIVVTMSEGKNKDMNIKRTSNNRMLH
jgi:hypothetical protein